MALVVTCPCGATVEALDSQVGQHVSCPSCGASVEIVRPEVPLATARFLQAAPEAPLEDVVNPGQPCRSCAGSGRCHYCAGSGGLAEPLLERITNGISNAIANLFGGVGAALGTDPHGKRKKFKTRSQRRQEGACPGCGGSGKCFPCEGSGRQTS